MSYKATLTMSTGTQYELLSSSYTWWREVDAKGRPTSKLKGGQILLSLASTADTSIQEQMANRGNTGFNCKVDFYDSNDATMIMKTLIISNCYIVNCAEVHSAGGTLPMMIEFTLSAEKMQIGNAIHTNEWPNVGSMAMSAS